MALNTTTNLTFNWTGYLAKTQMTTPRYIRIGAVATTLLLNFAILALYVRHRSLRTPFAVYLINLLVANLLFTALLFVDHMIKLVQPGWQSRAAVCDAYLYAWYPAAMAMTWAQVLVVQNRLWAVTFPFSYRLYHSHRVAVAVCVVKWMFVHILTLPFLILEFRLYRRPFAERGCDINYQAQYITAHALQVCIYDFPVIAVVALYPIIWYRMNTRKATKPKTSANGTMEQSKTETKTDGGSAFLMMTLLMVNVVVCWLPTSLVYIIMSASNLMLLPCYGEVLLVLADVFCYSTICNG
ncbi:5-hydroxytryptamine receptor 1B-like [Paramacrobiotus metropolitanus]|uniref:5-hydroxytryptamine receptor 1B-like n=1 Tax=Paramacrobiotus metropolitanus TaxID=2943436 RepID=UPI0024456111|nr:5-hydroxytryptamine receptor 1B-like [Paramacrobiotus metropolitanus]